jgi:hypothetical protein
VTSPWGVDYFLEAFGYGLYADLLYFYAPEQGKSLLRSISALSKTLSTPRRHICRVTLDGEEITGEFLMLEALNTTAMGPRVKLAPDADPDDGLFEVVRIREDKRDSLLAYINGLLTETLDELPSVEVSRGRRLEITCNEGFPFHVDAEVIPYTASALEPNPGGDDKGDEQQSGETQTTEARYDFPCPEGPMVVEILPRALEIWLPQPVEEDLPAEAAQAGGTPASLESTTE